MRKSTKPQKALGETQQDFHDIERGRAVMAALFGEPDMGLREIATELGTSRGTVFNLERRALCRLGRRMRELADG